MCAVLYAMQAMATCMLSYEAASCNIDTLELAHAKASSFMEHCPCFMLLFSVDEQLQ